MSSEYISKYVVCPYYHRHDDNRICCEGVTKSNTINIVFPNPIKLKNYTINYCNSVGNFNNCLICKALNQKYGVNT